MCICNTLEICSFFYLDKNKCEKEYAKVYKLKDAFIPKCKPDGTYEEKQCQESTNLCWCVDSEKGKEILGTKKGPGRREMKCGMDS